MKFGKLHDVSTVDFRLPPDAPMTQRVLSDTKNADAPPRIYVGCTGWSMKAWVGTVYPKGAKTADFIRYYGEQFNTIELNTTHYRIPTFDTIRRWKNSVPDDFRFCPKLPQAISHHANLGIGTGRIEQFCEVVQGLGKQLGCCFMQLPPYFGINRMNILKHFAEIFPSHIPLAVEIRHEAWFSNRNHFMSFFQLLEHFQFSSVITDVAGRRDVLHQCLTTPTAMIRFVGNGLHPTDFKRIDTWVERLDTWIQQGLREVYFFTHQPDNIRAPEMADYLVTQLRAKNYTVRGPRFIMDDNPQMTLF